MASAPTAAKKVTLTSCDGEKFVVDEEVAMESQIFKNMIEDGCADTDIPVPKVTGKILAKVIKYLEKHVGVQEQADTDIPLPNVTGKILAKVIRYFKKLVGVQEQAGEEIKTWNARFVKVDQATLFDLIMAANYLNIKSLLDLTCQTVADMIKGMNPEEMRRALNIKSDFTPEQKEEVRRENSWAFE